MGIATACTRCAGTCSPAPATRTRRHSPMSGRRARRRRQPSIATSPPGQPSSTQPPGALAAHLERPAAIVELQALTLAYAVAEMQRAGSLDHVVERQLDALLEGQVDVEQAHAGADQHRPDVELQTLDEPELERRAHQRAAAGDRDVPAPRGLTRQLDGPLEPVGDIGEAGAATPME